MMDDIKRLIDEKEIISFDIFDTLLFRNISRPIDVFRTMDKEILEEYNIKDFSKIRVQAEIDARKIINRCDVFLDEIYQEINKIIKNKKITDSIKRIEIEREHEFITVNPFMKKIYDYCIDNNKQIYFISDMYLDSKTITSLLTSNGYKVNNNLYVSCEANAMKGDSSLFKYVKEKNNLDYSKWIHIGDNYNSDYLKPRELGINSYQYKNVNSIEENNSKTIFESIILGIRNKYVYNGLENDYWNNFGYKYLAPIYFGFTNYIYLLTKNDDNIFFLARDGYILKKIYELFPNNNKFINYLYVSRKSLQIPSMFVKSRDKLLNYTSVNNKKITLKKFINNHFINIDMDEDIIKLFGFNTMDDIITSKNFYNAEKLVSHYWKELDSKIKEDYALAKEYLIQEGLTKFDKINVVDVGWGGSIQEAISNILDKDIYGYYFGTIPAGKKNYKTKSFGYMFDQSKPERLMKKIFSQVMMYEFIFSAPHGSTNNYIKNNNKIEPVLDDNYDYLDIVDKFQESSLNMIKEIMKYYKYYDNLDNEFCLSFYDKFLKEKDFNDLKMFEIISNDMELGRNDKNPYIQLIDKKDILNRKRWDLVTKKTSKSLWNGCFLINGIDTKEEYDKLSMKYKKKMIKKDESINHPSILIKVRRKIIPYKVRYIIKKTIKR